MNLTNRAQTGCKIFAFWLLLLGGPAATEEIVSYTHRPYRVEPGGDRAVPGEVVTFADLLTGTRWLSPLEQEALLPTLAQLPRILHLPDSFPAVRMWGLAFAPFLETARSGGVAALSAPPWPGRLATFPSFHLRFFLLLRRDQPHSGARIPFPQPRQFEHPFPPKEALLRPPYAEFTSVRDVTPAGWSNGKRLLHGDLIDDRLLTPDQGPFLALSQRLAGILSALARNPRPELLNPEERTAWSASTPGRRSRIQVTGKDRPPVESVRSFCQALLESGWRIEIDDIRRFANLADLVFIDREGIRHDVATPLWIDTGLPVRTGRDGARTLLLPMPHTHLTMRFFDETGRLRAQILYYYGWWGGPTFLPEVGYAHAWIGHRVASRVRSPNEILRVAGAIDAITFRIGWIVHRLGGSRASHGHGNLGTCLRPSALIERILHPTRAATFYPLTANPTLDREYGTSTPLARAVQELREVGDDVLRPPTLDESLRQRIGACLPVHRIEDLAFPTLIQNLEALGISAPGRPR